MNRRTIMGLAAATAAILPGFRRASAGDEPGASTTGKKVHGVVLHVGQNDAVMMNIALKNVMNAYKVYSERGAEFAAEIVATGPGLHMFRDDTSPVKAHLKEVHEQMPQVVLSACENTKRAMEASEGKTITILPEARMVPAGVVRIMELEEQGWSYVWA